MADAVGVVFGEVEQREFKFLVTKGSEVHRGAYVKVKHEIYGWVIAQVVELKRYNELYSLKIMRSGKEKEIQSHENVVADAKVIGYVDEKNMLSMPKVPFMPGAEVYLADGSLISKSLGLKSKSGGIYIGVLETDRSTPVYVDANKLLQKHVCVLAKTGAGKSYTVGVLIEELAEKGISAVIIDPHGEYSSLKVPNKNSKELELMEKFGIEPKGYANVIEFTPYLSINPSADRRFVLDITKISPRDLTDALPTKIPDTQKALILEAVKTARTFGSYTIDDIINIVNQSGSKSKWNIITNLESLKESKIFDGAPVKVEDLVKPGIVSIINLKGAQPEVQQLVVMTIATELFEARKRGALNPFLLLLEEAHNFCPERGLANAISSKIIRTIASEGRKFGIGLCVVSQRPARIDKNVLSQCNTQIILKITNPNDLRAISQSIEGFTPDLEEEIKELQAGVALIVGEVVEQPIIARIRVKHSHHGGVSIEIVKERKERAASGMLKGGILKGGVRGLFRRGEKQGEDEETEQPVEEELDEEESPDAQPRRQKVKSLIHKLFLSD